MKKLLALFVFLTVFFVASHAYAAVYYFNNAVNTDPTELGNYWYDQGEREVPPSDPALELPDLSVDEVTVLSDAIYNGDAVFRVAAQNRGTVTGNAFFYDGSTNDGDIEGDATFNGETLNNSSVLGDAIFNGTSRNVGTVAGNATFNDISVNEADVTGDALYNDDSSHNGTVGGTKTRRFDVATTSEEDFITSAAWILIADGVIVNLAQAPLDNTITLTTENGGSFITSAFLHGSVNYNTLTLTYSRTLNIASVPDNNDYVVTVNGLTNSVTNVDIVGSSVVLTLTQPVEPDDVVQFSYVSGDTPLQDDIVRDLSSINNQRVIYAIPINGSPNFFVTIGNKIYTSSLGSTTDYDVFVIDSLSDTVIESIDTPNNGATFISFIGNKVYINDQGGSVSVIDAVSDSLIENISVSNSPYFNTISNGKLYVSGSGASEVYVIDPNTNTILSVISTAPNPNYFVSVGDMLYIAYTSASQVDVIDTKTDAIVATIPLDTPVSIGTPIGTKIYFSGDDMVSVIDTTSDTLLTTIPFVGSAGFSTVVGTKLYVTNREEQYVVVIDTLTDTVLSTIAIDEEFYFSAVYKDHLYTFNQGGNTVTVIDTNTDIVVDTVTVGDSPYYSTFAANKLYVGNNSTSNISVINLDTISYLLPNLVSFSTSSASGSYVVGQSIPIAAHFGQSLAPGSTMTVLLNTGRSVTLNNVSGATLSGTYVIQSGDTTPDLSVRSITSASVTDATNPYTRTSYDLPSSVGDFEAENSFITRNLGDAKNIKIGEYQSFATGDNPYQLSTPINGFLYVVNQGAGTVSVINATTGELADTIDVGDEPYGLAVVGTELYVANTGSNTVSVINTATNTLTHTINVDVKPYYVATIGTNVYVTNSLSNTVSVIDTGTHTVTDTIPVGSYPRGIKAHGTDLYVANYGDPNYSGGNYISVIDSLTNEVSDTIILPAGSDGPRGVTTLADKVYVSNFRSNNISVIDTATNEITDTIDVGTGPRGLLGTGTTLYVENFDDGTISVIDTNTNTVTGTVEVGHSPSGMSFSGTTLYITSFQDDRVYAMNTATNTLIEAEQEAEEETPIRTITSSGGYAAITLNSSLPTIPPTDCLPSYNFSPSTGKLCPSSSTPTTPITSPILSPFTRDLKLGMIGEDVKALQIYLNTHGFPAALTGPGSKGFETTKFGSLTQKALMKFQQANKISPSVGYFGKITRTFVDAHN